MMIDELLKQRNGDPPHEAYVNITRHLKRIAGELLNKQHNTFLRLSQSEL